MADHPKDQKTSKKGSDKPQPETVLLTADELRAIAGGASQPGGGTSPGGSNNPKGLTKDHGLGK